MRLNVIIYLQEVYFYINVYMNKIPEDLLYSKEHEWVRVKDNVAEIGITDYAQNSLGDIVYIDGPENDIEIEANSVVATIESVKAVSDIYAPVSGKVVEVNESLQDNPALVNTDPYSNGWLFKVNVSQSSQIESLLNASQYADFLKTLE